jgi:hypothetical protein
MRPIRNHGPKWKRTKNQPTENHPPEEMMAESHRNEGRGPNEMARRNPQSANHGKKTEIRNRFANLLKERPIKNNKYCAKRRSIYLYKTAVAACALRRHGAIFIILPSSFILWIPFQIP